MEDPRDPITGTQSTYDAIAASYQAQWADRSVMERSLDRFADHLHARGGGTRVLDVGCGPGFDAVALSARGLQAVGMDLSWGMLRQGRDRYAVPLLQGDMRRLPFGRCFDGLWVNASLLHLPRTAVPAALAGFWRVLQPAGLFFLSLKAGTGDAWMPHVADPDRRRYFTFWTLSQVEAALDAAGFAAIEGASNAAGDTTWLSFFAVRSVHG